LLCSTKKDAVLSKNVLVLKSMFCNALITNNMGGGGVIRFIKTHLVVLYLQPYLLSY
jgi:hypothetical protein